MKKPVVTLVNASDWTGLFVGDKLVSQGHTIPEFDMLDVLKDVGKFTWKEREANDQALDTFGQFADTIEQNEKDGIL